MLFRSKKSILSIAFIILFVSVFLKTTAYSQKKGTNSKYYIRKNQTISIVNEKYWETVSPKMFMDTLIKYGKGYNFLIFKDPKKSWFDSISPKYIVTFLSDNRNYASIVSSVNESRFHADINKQNTFASTQAKFLLLGYYVKRYPPTVCSYHSF